MTVWSPCRLMSATRSKAPRMESKSSPVAPLGVSKGPSVDSSTSQSGGRAHRAASPPRLRKSSETLRKAEQSSSPLSLALPLRWLPRSHGTAASATGAGRVGTHLVRRSALQKERQTCRIGKNSMRHPMQDWEESATFCVLATVDYANG